MIHEIGGPKVEPIQGFPKLEGLAEPSMLKKVAGKIGNHFSEIYDTIKIDSVVESLKNRACFCLNDTLTEFFGWIGKS